MSSWSWVPDPWLRTLGRAALPCLPRPSRHSWLSLEWQETCLQFGDYFFMRWLRHFFALYKWIQTHWRAQKSPDLSPKFCSLVFMERRNDRHFVLRLRVRTLPLSSEALFEPVWSKRCFPRRDSRSLHRSCKMFFHRFWELPTEFPASFFVSDANSRHWVSI